VKFPFNPALGTILVGGELTGPSASTIVVLALDTGASGTTINADRLTAIGFDLSQYSPSISMATGTGVVQVARLPVASFKALGRIRSPYSVFAHTLPQSTGVDGVLGLDFFHDLILTLDFRKGEITVASSPTP
jgi:predicted aspartyl protease